MLLYIFFVFLHTNQDISSKEDFCGLCPHPVSGIRMGISGNTANVDGIRLEQSVVFGRLFRLLRLQVLGEAFPIKYGQLVQYPVPVPVTLRPFFDYIPTCKIKHLLQCAVTWKHTLCLCNFPILAV